MSNLKNNMSKFNVIKTIVRGDGDEFSKPVVINCSEEDAIFYIKSYIEVCEADSEMKLHSVEPNRETPRKAIATCGHAKYLYEIETA